MKEIINTGRSPEKGEKDPVIIARTEALKKIFTEQELRFLAESFFRDKMPPGRPVEKPDGYPDFRKVSSIMETLDSAAGTDYSDTILRSWQEI